MDELIKKQVEKIKQEGEQIKKEVRERTLGYVIASFGLIAGLAWNEAIKALIEYLFPLNTNTLLAKFAYAILITIAVVIITVYLVRLFKKQQQNIDLTNDKS